MHSCPTCGQACYCNGDIDDIECDPTAADRCDCCDDEDDCDEYDDLEEEPNGRDERQTPGE